MSDWHCFEHVPLPAENQHLWEQIQDKNREYQVVFAHVIKAKFKGNVLILPL